MSNQSPARSLLHDFAVTWPEVDTGAFDTAVAVQVVQGLPACPHCRDTQIAVLAESDLANADHAPAAAWIVCLRERRIRSLADFGMGTSPRIAQAIRDAATNASYATSDDLDNMRQAYGIGRVASRNENPGTLTTPLSHREVCRLSKSECILILLTFMGKAPQVRVLDSGAGIRTTYDAKVSMPVALERKAAGTGTRYKRIARFRIEEAQAAKQAYDEETDVEVPARGKLRISLLQYLDANLDGVSERHRVRLLRRLK